MNKEIYILDEIEELGSEATKEELISILYKNIPSHVVYVFGDNASIKTSIGYIYVTACFIFEDCIVVGYEQKMPYGKKFAFFESNDMTCDDIISIANILEDYGNEKITINNKK